jgi:hypothetical protein
MNEWRPKKPRADDLASSCNASAYRDFQQRVAIDHELGNGYLAGGPGRSLMDADERVAIEFKALQNRQLGGGEGAAGFNA